MKTGDGGPRLIKSVRPAGRRKDDARQAVVRRSTYSLTESNAGELKIRHSRESRCSGGPR
jgi:hypothetical protein